MEPKPMQPPAAQPAQPSWDSSPNGSWGPAEGPGGRRAERSPIFEAMTSEWFQKRPVDESAPFPDPDAWRSPADAGWETAAATTANPVDGGRTTSGLPKRVPGRNRVPGRVPGGNQDQSGPAAPSRPPQQASPQQQAPPQGMPQRVRPPAPAVPPGPPQGPPAGGPPRRLSPEEARARLGGFQRGVQRGRTDARSGSWPTVGNGGPEQHPEQQSPGNAPGRGEDDFETGETT